MVRLCFKVDDSKLIPGDNMILLHTFYGNVRSLEHVFLVKEPSKNGVYKL